MVRKQVLAAERVRRTPIQFSWVDQRLVRDGYLDGLSAEALALYLFLVTVADAEGLSFYSDSSVCRIRSISQQILSGARAELARAGLIAYQKPLYQVLSLDPGERGPESARHYPQLEALTKMLAEQMGGKGK